MMEDKKMTFRDISTLQSYGSKISKIEGMDVIILIMWLMISIQNDLLIHSFSAYFVLHCC